MVLNFEVVVGTYEQFTLGYKINQIVNEYKMERTFAMHSHLGSVRSIASKKNYLASAAADNNICLYDMRNRIEHGKLNHHNDTVNCISFTPDASHIITGSKDGSMAIIRCGNWQIEKHLENSHKGLSVDSLAVHPTGKLALTTGADGILRTWNLINGRQAFATSLTPRLKTDAKFVSVLKWSPSGAKYIIGANKILNVYSIEIADVIHQLTFDTKIICAEFLDENLIAVGLMDGRMIVYDVEDGSQKLEIQAHKARLRCMAREGDYLVTASSDGEIKVWMVKKDDISMLSKANCDARILCMTLSMPDSKQIQKDEEEEDEEEKEEEDDEKNEEVQIKEQRKKIVRLQRVVVEDEGKMEVKKKKKKTKRSRDDKEEDNKIMKKKKVDVQKRKIEEHDDSLGKKKFKMSIEKKRKTVDKEEIQVGKKKIKTEIEGKQLVQMKDKQKKKNKKKQIECPSLESKVIETEPKLKKKLKKQKKVVLNKKMNQNMNLKLKKLSKVKNGSMMEGKKKTKTKKKTAMTR